LPRNRTLTDTKFNLDFYRQSPDETRILFGGLTGSTETDLRVMALRLGNRLANDLPFLQGLEISHCWTGNCAGSVDLYPHLGVFEGIHYAFGYCFSGVPMGTYL